MIIRPAAFKNIASRLWSITDLSEPAIASRIEGYRIGLEILREKPLLGAGPENFFFEFRRHMPASYLKYSGLLSNPGYAHNEIMQVAVDKGMMGLFLYAAILFLFFINARKKIKESPPPYRTAVTGIACSVAGLLVQNQFSFSTIATSVLFWTMLGSVDSGKKIINTELPFFLRKISVVLLCLAGFFALIYSVYSSGRQVCANSMFTEAEACMKNRNIDSALFYYAKAEKLEKGLSVYRLSYARALYMKAKEISGIEKKRELFERARKEYEIQSGLEKNNSLAWNGSGACLYELAKITGEEKYFYEGLDAFNNAVLLDPNLLDAHLSLGYLHEHMGNLEKALEAYSQAVKLDPDNETAHFNMGCIYANGKKTPEAIEQFKKVLEINPGNRKAVNYLGILEK